MALTVVPLREDAAPCGYFSELIFTSEHFLVRDIGDEDLELLLSRGYRHFGKYFFRPACAAVSGCTRCIPIRVRLGRYHTPRSAKRLFNRNSKFRTEITPPIPSLEAFELYKLHKNRFENGGTENWRLFRESFFYPLPGARQLSVYDGGKLIAVTHFDETPRALSAIYTYYDETYYRESLGTYNIFKLAELGRTRDKRWLYLGYYIRENRHMSYKTRFKPNELCVSEGKWHTYVDEWGEPHNRWMVEKGFCPKLRLFSFQEYEDSGRH
jgi:arginine-tRNA-protein transferase